MKKFVFISALALSVLAFPFIHPVSGTSSNLGITADSGGGHYQGGKGSSHKGGKYKNASTGNHYHKRKR